MYNNNKCFYTTQGDIKCNNNVENFVSYRKHGMYDGPCNALDKNNVSHSCNSGLFCKKGMQWGSYCSPTRF